MVPTVKNAVPIHFVITTELVIAKSLIQNESLGLILPHLFNQRILIKYGSRTDHIQIFSYNKAIVIQTVMFMRIVYSTD